MRLGRLVVHAAQWIQGTHEILSHYAQKGCHDGSCFGWQVVGFGKLQKNCAGASDVIVLLAQHNKGAFQRINTFPIICRLVNIGRMILLSLRCRSLLLRLERCYIALQFCDFFTQNLCLCSKLGDFSTERFYRFCGLGDAVLRLRYLHLAPRLEFCKGYLLLVLLFFALGSHIFEHLDDFLDACDRGSSCIGTCRKNRRWACDQQHEREGQRLHGPRFVSRS
mmetsp:Transcript_113193/g.176893  ORF Transcript_113193/g.176893 Transcript_113193/m.176893 type:complete len:222 (+) Transcript_113193:1573-2238(+)